MWIGVVDVVVFGWMLFGEVWEWMLLVILLLVLECLWLYLFDLVLFGDVLVW